MIRIQGRHSRFEIFSLFYEFSYFHLFCLFFYLKSYIWKRLTFRVISTFYGNINTCALGFHMALAHRRVPKVLVYFCIFGNYSSFDEVLVFTHRMLQKKSIDVHITLCGKNFKCKNYRFTVVHYNVQYWKVNVYIK